MRPFLGTKLLLLQLLTDLSSVQKYETVQLQLGEKSLET